MFGQPKPRFAIYSPYYTPAGPAVFGRDRDSSRQVWSQREGYPGDPAYPRFLPRHRAGFADRISGPFLPSDHRRNTGLKYHRITGQGANKELYNLGWAAAAADSHAGHFWRAA